MPNCLQRFCTSAYISLIRSFFITFNGFIILASVGLILYNLLITFGGEQIQDVFEETIMSFGITPSMFNYILTTSSLLCGLFSGIATMGMEAANFRDHWENPVFEVCGMSMLRVKMGIYSVITGIGALTIAVLTSLLQTDIIPFTFESILEVWTLGGPNDVFSGLIDPLQEDYQCCGIQFLNETEAQENPQVAEPCGGYFHGIPKGCDCDGTDKNLTNCFDAAYVNAKYKCNIREEKYIYTDGCLETFTRKYLSEFSVFWIIFYGIAAALFVGFLLSIFICFEPGTGKIESSEDDEEMDAVTTNKYMELRKKYLVLVEKARELKKINDELGGQVNQSYY